MTLLGRNILSQLTPFSDPEEVLRRIKPVTDSIHLGLRHLLPITRQWFETQNVTIDKACHAMMTRVLLKRELMEKQLMVSDEVDEQPEFRVQGLANCGLIITGTDYNLRVLKSRDGELPPAQSMQRHDFYQGNLFTFEVDDPHPDAPIPPLNLVAAWETDREHDLRSLAIVCPWGQSDNRVVCKWGRTLVLPIQDSPAPSHLEVLPPEPALDEITPRDTAEPRTQSIKRNLGIRNGKTDRAT